MKINHGKCHLVVSTNGNVAIRIGNFQIEATKRETVWQQAAFRLSFIKNMQKS